MNYLYDVVAKACSVNGHDDPVSETRVSLKPVLSFGAILLAQLSII